MPGDNADKVPDAFPMSEHRIQTLPVTDLQSAQRFYTRVLGCRHATCSPSRLPATAPTTSEGEMASADGPHVNLELFGQPLALRQSADAPVGTDTRLVLVLDVDDWCALSERLREHGIEHSVETARRFSIEPGEQCRIRLDDPDGNVIELRGFTIEETRLAA